MHKQHFPLLLTLLLILGATHSQAQNWKPLFNGKNLKGWQQLGGKADIKVEDGAIVGYSRLKEHTFLATKKQYGDFILEFEFQVADNLNSGVQIRSHSLKTYRDGRVHGLQFEIDPSPRAWTGGLYDEARRGWLYPLTKNPPAKTAFRKGQWNHARIEAFGPHIRTWVNGQPCANLLATDDLNGFIALQVHEVYRAQDEHQRVAWRNLRILTDNVQRHLTPQPLAPEVNAIDNTLSPQERADGWQLLWDGQTTNGWRGARLNHFPQQGWTINNGELTVLSSGGAEAAGGGDIITTQQYQNFILSVDFKITRGANSGIKYFVDPNLNQGTGSAIGCEFQILDDNVHPDAKLGVRGNRKLGALYDLIPAPDDKPFRPGFFNTAVIVVQGSHVEHYLNDILLFSYERQCPMWNALVAYSKYRDWPNFGNAQQGHILLQDHGDEVSFKNIKIKPLP